MRFQTDENLPAEAAQLLRDAGHEALTVLDQRMQGAPYSRVASVCRDAVRVLVTLDLDFADVRSYQPGDQPGIIILRPSNQAKPTVMTLLEHLIPLLETERLAGSLWIMQPNGLRIRQGSDQS